MSEPPTITCPACGMTSANPTDVTEGWCGKCKAYTGAMVELTGFETSYPRMTPMHFDRQGHPITFARWTWLYEYGMETGYRRVDDTYIGEHWRVSTIWEGISIPLALPGSVPMVFETAVFKDGELMDTFKWPSEDSARKGHELCVAQFTEIAAENDGAKP